MRENRTWKRPHKLTRFPHGRRLPCQKNENIQTLLTGGASPRNMEQALLALELIEQHAKDALFHRLKGYARKDTSLFLVNVYVQNLSLAYSSTPGESCIIPMQAPSVTYTESSEAETPLADKDLRSDRSDEAASTSAKKSRTMDNDTKRYHVSGNQLPGIPLMSV